MPALKPSFISKVLPLESNIYRRCLNALRATQTGADSGEKFVQHAGDDVNLRTSRAPNRGLLLRRGAPSVLALLLASAVLTACGEDLSCSSDATTKLMDQIARTELKKGFPPGDPTPDKVGLTVKEIVTTDKTKTRATCKAKFEIKTPDTPVGDLPVTYHVEKTDDGRLYVTIFGL